MELDEDQRTALRAGSKQVRRAAALLRSVNPESFKAAEQAKRICAQAWGSQADEPTVEEVTQGFAGLMRFCPALGPSTQETLRNNLDSLIERMGLTSAVYRTLEVPEIPTATARGR